MELLFLEAPAKKPETDGSDEFAIDSSDSGKKAKDAEPSDPPPEDPPADDGGDPPADDGGDPPAEDPPADSENDPSDEEDGVVDSGFSDGGETAAYQEALKSERLYDQIVSYRNNAKQLSDAVEILLTRIPEASSKDMLGQIKVILGTVQDQCDTLLTRFQDIGYTTVLGVSTSIRERVTTVAEILKHVIDGDENFREPDSGKTN